MEGQLILAAPAAILASTPEALRLSVEADPNSADRAIFEFNKLALAGALRALGITRVTVEYSGGGDEGRTESITFEPNDQHTSHTVNVALMKYRWDEERACGGSELAFDDMALDQVAEALCDTAISLTGHNGYENNDGGAGTFVLQAADATAELEHSDYYTESDTTSHAL
jgi:hypothetical protein